MSITAHATVDEFFRDILQDALSRQGVSASEPTEFYLVGLLGEYAKGRVMDRPLSLHLVESGHKGTGERVKALKGLKLAISTPGSGTDQTLRFILQSLHADVRQEADREGGEEEHALAQALEVHAHPVLPDQERGRQHVPAGARLRSRQTAVRHQERAPAERRGVDRIVSA